MELLCPAGNLAALKAALNAGADAVYVGLRNDTNARSFAGLNFTPEKLAQAVHFTHRQGRQIFLTLNTFAKPGQEARWHRAIDIAADSHVDALIVADLSLLQYAKDKYPGLPLHLSVQASASNAAALRFYQQAFGIERAVLPRVLSWQQVAQLIEQKIVDIEVFAYGSLCIMAEGRCHLSSWVTGQSPNTGGSCSPASDVRWEEQGQVRYTRLNRVLIDKSDINEQLGYPVVCKGRYQSADQRTDYLLEKPTSLNTLELLPQMYQAGVRSLKIEGRQRSPAYVTQVTQAWRRAIDTLLHAPENFLIEPQWQQVLDKVAEGNCTTQGAYNRHWQ